MICIYKYTNKINKKAYIGLTNDMDRRRREHRLVARKKKDNTYFHNALQKYGEDNFDFEILEVFKQEDRVLMGERESY